MLVNQLFNKQEFYLDGSIGFDFTARYPVTFVQFVNFDFAKIMSIKDRVKSMRDRFGANIIIIIGGTHTDVSSFRYNLDGIRNLITWTDPYKIGEIIDVLLKFNGSKYNVFYGDCAGAYTAIIASKRSSVNSILLTTPVIDASDMKNNGYSALEIPGHGFRESVVKNINIDITVLDAYPVLVQHLNIGTRIVAHWSANPRGTDLYEKERLYKLKHFANLELVEHQMPHDLDQHMLARWLSSENKLSQLYAAEVNIGKVYVTTCSQ
jgi:hypothetical protein